MTLKGPGMKWLLAFWLQLFFMQAVGSVSTTAPPSGGRRRAAQPYAAVSEYGDSDYGESADSMLNSITSMLPTSDCDTRVPAAVHTNMLCVADAGTDEVMKCDCASMLNKTLAPCLASSDLAVNVSATLMTQVNCVELLDPGPCPALVSMAVDEQQKCQYKAMDNTSAMCECAEKFNHTVAMCVSDILLPESLKSLLRSHGASDACNKLSLTGVPEMACNLRAQTAENQFEWCQQDSARDNGTGYNETILCDCLYRFDYMPPECQDLTVTQRSPWAEVQPKCQTLLPGVETTKSCLTKVRAAAVTLGSCDADNSDEFMDRCACLDNFKSSVSIGMCADYPAVKMEVGKTHAKYAELSSKCLISQTDCVNKVADASSAMGMCVTGARDADGGQNITAVCMCLDTFNKTTGSCAMQPRSPLPEDIATTMQQQETLYPQCKAILANRHCADVSRRATADFTACTKAAGASLLGVCSCATAFENSTSECRGKDSGIDHELDTALLTTPQVSQCAKGSEGVQCVSLVRGAMSELAVCRLNAKSSEASCKCVETYNMTVAPCRVSPDLGIDDTLKMYDSNCKANPATHPSDIILPNPSCAAVVVPAVTALHLCTSTAGDSVEAVCRCTDTFNESVRECTTDPVSKDQIHEAILPHKQKCANSGFQNGEQLTGELVIQVENATAFINDPRSKVAAAKAIASLAGVPKETVSVTWRALGSRLRRLAARQLSESVEAHYTMIVPADDPRHSSEVALAMTAKTPDEVSALMTSEMQAAGITTPITVSSMSSATVTTTTTTTTTTSSSTSTTTTTEVSGGIPLWAWFVVLAICLICMAMAVVLLLVSKGNDNKPKKKKRAVVKPSSDQVPLVGAQLVQQAPLSSGRLDANRGGLVSREEFMRQVLSPTPSPQMAQLVQPTQPPYTYGQLGQLSQPQIAGAPVYMQPQVVQAYQYPQGVSTQAMRPA